MIVIMVIGFKEFGIYLVWGLILALKYIKINLWVFYIFCLLIFYEVVMVNHQNIVYPLINNINLIILFNLYILLI
jgi:hypothetical protein